jgi:Tfp pilus assembly protein PilV
LRRSWFNLMAIFFGVAALILALGDLALVIINRSARRETDEQRQFIQQTAQLNGISETLIRQIARAAVEDKDEQLRDLLISQGFHIHTEGPTPTATQPSADKK